MKQHLHHLRKPHGIVLLAVLVFISAWSIWTFWAWPIAAVGH
jgi:hypothetical protein